MQHVLQQSWWSGPEARPQGSSESARALVDVLLHGLRAAEVLRGGPHMTSEDPP